MLAARPRLGPLPGPESTDGTMPRRLCPGQWRTGDGSDRQQRL